MKFFIHMVVKNEAARYLEEVLEWHAQLGAVHVYDDCSEDITRDIAEEFAIVSQRTADDPTFLEDEGNFRCAGWRAFEEAMAPQVGDWVLALDADEFLTSTDQDVDSHLSLRMQLSVVLRRAEAAECGSVMLPVPEIFKIDGGKPLERVDRLWGTIAGTRLFRYRPHGVFRRGMASGAEPTYVTSGPPTWEINKHKLCLLHYGYARPIDQEMKYARYTSLQHNHNNEHIESIMARDKRLEPFLGYFPEIK